MNFLSTYKTYICLLKNTASVPIIAANLHFASMDEVLIMIYPNYNAIHPYYKTLMF